MANTERRRKERGMLRLTLCFSIILIGLLNLFVYGKIPGVDQQEKWFTKQKLNHFDSMETRVYSQRYFEIDQYWDAPDGPVILNICGEYTCTGLMDSRLYPLQLAQKYKALVVSVEHRFFGLS